MSPQFHPKCRNPDCGRPRRRDRCGWCIACYDRWRYHGCPEDGPPPPWAKVPGRIEDYLWLRDELGLSRAAAAARVGVTLRTIQRYERRLRMAAA